MSAKKRTIKMNSKKSDNTAIWRLKVCRMAQNQKDMKEKRMVSVLIPKDGFTGLIAQKTGRNKVCPCGSGKKAKKCCGADTKYYSRQPCDSETSEDRKRRFDGIK